MKRAVFVFGAGASASAGLPVQANLFRDYFEAGEACPDSFRNELVSFFSDFFHIDVRHLDQHDSFPTFEEALGVLELAIDKEETFSPNYPLPKMREIRDALVYSMGIAIERKTVRSTNTYHKFVRKLFHNGHFADGEYAFINFNYDILLDKALMDLKFRKKKIMIDYGIRFANETAEGQGGKFQEWSPVSGEAVHYLKPHGSYNWMHCPTCNSMYILVDQKSEVFRTGYIQTRENCIKDKTPLDCVIEPPSFFKKYKNLYLQNIWNAMTQLLFQADVVIFVGYSLPDADMWTKYALKRSCFDYKRKLIVVNPATQEAETYRRFLGEVEHLNKTFDDYVSDWTRHHETWR